MRGSPERVLVFRVGQLGDMIMSLPAVWAVRQYWPNARLSPCCAMYIQDAHMFRARRFSVAHGVFESIEHYEVPLRLGLRSQGNGTPEADAKAASCCATMTLVYLAPSIRGRSRSSAISSSFALPDVIVSLVRATFRQCPARNRVCRFRRAIQRLTSSWRALRRMEFLFPAKGQGSIDMCLGDNEASELERWRSKLGSDGGRTWIGVGPGSKMPAKRWPLERFGEVVSQLIARHDIWPVIFGGPEDRAEGEMLIARWGRGFNAAGELGCAPRPSR